MMRHHKFWSVLAIAGLTLATAGCAEETESPGGGETGGATGGAGGGEAEEGPIKMGVVLDITGAGASLGVAERETIEMLAEQVTENGGIDGRELEVIIEDNQSTEDGAAKATSKLLSEGVHILVGASRTGPSLAMRPLAEDAKIPMISLAANQKIVDGSEWVFKTAQNDRVVLERIVDDMKANGYQKVSVARDASGFGEGIPEMLTEIGKEAGIEVVAVEKFAPDATDFTAQMVNIRNSDPDAVLIWGIPPAAALAQKAYAQLNLGKPVYQSHGIGNQAFLDAAGDTADGLHAALGRMLIADQLPDDDPQKEVVTTFIRDYEEKWGKAPSTFAGHAYDGFMIAVNALDEVGTDPQALRDELESVADWPGVSGVFTMTPEDHSGLTKDALMIVTVEDGTWKILEDSR